MNEPNNTTPKKNVFFTLIIPIFSLICLIVIGFLLYLSFYASASDKLLNGFLLVLAGIFAIIILYFLFIYGLNYARILKILNGDYFVHWQYPKESGRGDVYFCHEGVYETDSPYQALDTFGDKFISVEIPADKTDVIRLTKRPHRKRFADSRRVHEVPIPPGKAEEAEKMVQRFSGYIGRRSNYQKDQARFVLPMIGAVFLWIFLSFTFVQMFAVEEVKIARSEQAKELRHQSNINEITPLWNKIRQTLEPKIEQFKTLPDGRLTAKEAGFDENSEVLTVLHGRCSNNGFYVSVVLKKGAITKSYYGNETGAFNYTTSSPIPTNPTVNFCKPPIQDYFENRILLSDGWVYGEVISRPYLPTPSPAANSQTNKNGK